jgi:hypothetical protein
MALMQLGAETGSGQPTSPTSGVTFIKADIDVAHQVGDCEGRAGDAAANDGNKEGALRKRPCPYQPLGAFLHGI